MQSVGRGESPRGAGPLGRSGACPLLGQKGPLLATGAVFGIGADFQAGRELRGFRQAFLPSRRKPANRSTSRR